MKDRQLWGMGAAACAICCAVPILALLGIAGMAAAVATIASAGVVFVAVVGGAALFTVWAGRRQQQRSDCGSRSGPVDVELTPPPRD